MSEAATTCWLQGSKIAYEVNEDSTIVNMVVQGLGAAILPFGCRTFTARHVCSLPVPLEKSGGCSGKYPSNSSCFAFLDTLRSADRFTLKRQFDLCSRDACGAIAFGGLTASLFGSIPKLVGDRALIVDKRFKRMVPRNDGAMGLRRQEHRCIW